MPNQIQTLLKAVAFAARAHKNQWRKDKETPYASHVFRVCLVARHVFGIDDERILTAAVLHDCVEDTTTDFDDIRQEFGVEIAEWVALLSKDKRLPEEEREAAYMKQLIGAGWQVKVCKLADIYDNLNDSTSSRPEQRAKTLLRSKQYLDSLRDSLPEQARPAFAIVTALIDSMKRE